MSLTESLENLNVNMQEEQDINTSLVSLLECPVCLNYMIPPITQCQNGHNVCSVCIPQLVYCPVCRDNLAGASSRNLFAEQLAQKGIFPCKNAEIGCRESFKLAEMQKHTSVCPYRNYECLIMKDDCDWRGRRSELYNHVSNVHEGKAWNSEIVRFKCPEGFGTTVFNTNGVIATYDEVFYVSLDWKDDEKKMFGTVQYIGQKENASKFKYKFEFYNGTNKVKHQHTTNPEAVNVADIHKTGECLCIDTNLAKLFVQSNKLQFNLYIIKA